MFSNHKFNNFDKFDKINKSSAVFNYQKLRWFNGIYIRKLTIGQLYELILPRLREANIVEQNIADQDKELILKILPLIQERMETLNDAPGACRFFFGDIPEYQEWQRIYPKKVEKDTLLNILNDVKEIITHSLDNEDEELKHKIYQLTEKHQVKAGAVFMPIRIAVTGTHQSPDLVPVLKILGKDKLQKRLDYTISKIKSE